MNKRALLAVGLLAGMSFSIVQAAEWTDPAGDVTSPVADIVAGSATIANGMVDLRVQLVVDPFPPGNRGELDWLLDLDQNPATTHQFLMNYPGADAYVAVYNEPVIHGIAGLSLCANGSIDRTTHSLRIVFPASLLPGVSVFNYGLFAAFGGSQGANENAPDRILFSYPGDYFTSDADTPAPFQGEALCRGVGLDVLPQGKKDTINLGPKNRVVGVAILSDADFDAVAEIEAIFTTFGPTGTEARAQDCTSTADVNGDGLTDVICQFAVDETGFHSRDTIGRMVARTISGAFIYGSDAVQIQGGN